MQQEEQKARQGQIARAKIQVKTIPKSGGMIGTKTGIARPLQLNDIPRAKSKYHENGDIYFVPVRGLANFHQVNKYAEFLGINFLINPTLICV